MEDKSEREMSPAVDFALGMAVGALLGGVIIGWLVWYDCETKWRKDAVINGFAAYSVDGTWHWRDIRSLRRQWEREKECE